MMSKNYFLLTIVSIFMMSLTSLWSQTTIVTGTVVDESGVPVPGVNITVEGSTKGTSTDFDGNYSLEASQGQTLKFSSVGFQDQSVAVGSSSTIDVTLREGTSLDEVVVTALGISREKRSLGYATQEVDEAVINQANPSNVASALSGKIAGIQIRKNTTLGGSTNVIIRGNNSLTGDNQALWVIDGVPLDNSNYSSSNDSFDYGNAIGDINPDDIESMNVLKGAAATALYGSRAANGAVIIKTKSGKGKKSFGVSLSSGVTFSSIDTKTFPKYQNEYGSGYGAVNGPNNDSYFNEQDIDGDGVMDLVAPYNQYGGWGAAYDPNLMVYQWDAYYPESPDYQVASPWVMPKNGPLYMMNKPITLDNKIAITGNSESSSYRFSYSKISQEGIIPESSVDRDNFSLNSSFNLTDRLTASASANYIKTKTKGRSKGGIGGSYTNFFTNFRQYWQPNIDFKKLEALYNDTEKNLTQFPTGTIDNTYYIIHQNRQSDSRNRFIGNVSLEYEINDWINVMGRGSIDTYNYLIEDKQNTLIRVPSEYNYRNIFFEEINYDLMLNFNKDLGDKFNINGVAGTNIRRSTFRSQYNETNGGLIVEKLYAISNSVGTPPATQESLREIGVNGIYGLVSVGYDNMLYVDVTGRNDWSSTLPSGNNSFFYPSVATSFVFSNLIESNVLSFGKLRLNYAEVGNSAPAHSLVDVLNKPTPFGSHQMYSVNTTKNNPFLKPENTISYEAGLETSFFKGRIDFNLSAYKTNTKNQIIPVAITPATGYSNRYINAGEVENKGLEILLSGTPIETDDFTWKTTVNWSTNKSEIVSLHEGVTNLQLYNTGTHTVTINARVGEPYGTIYGSDFEYVNGKKVVDQNTGYYKKTTTSNHKIGKMLPDWNGGINNSLRYKNLGLSFLIDIQKGGDIFSSDMAVGSRNGLYDNTTGTNELGNPVRSPVDQGGGLIMDGVAPDGSPNTVRSSFMDRDMPLSDQIAPNAMFIYDASYVKLREVVLSYQAPTAFVEKLSLSGLEFSIIGSNLWIIHKNIPYADPEAGLISGNVQGHHQGVFPSTRDIGFNIKLQF